MSFILDIMGDFIATQMQLHSKKTDDMESIFSASSVFYYVLSPRSSSLLRLNGRKLPIIDYQLADDYDSVTILSMNPMN